MARKAKRAAARGAKAKKTARKVTAKKAAPRKAANHGMIDLYTDTTPNGYKISIFLEEAKVPYASHYVDISAGDQFKPEFLAISPNNKIPAITDRNGPGGKPYSLFESGAILLYLAEKTGKFGPMLGQAGHFRNYAPEKIPYAINRYTNEANRLYGVMDKRLGEAPYLAGAYSIADMAVWPWLRYPERHGVNVDDFPNVKRWREAIAARPAVQRGLKILADKVRTAPMDDKAKEILFGATQYKKH
jgi:GST-like protein